MCGHSKEGQDLHHESTIIIIITLVAAAGQIISPMALTSISYPVGSSTPGTTANRLRGN